MSTCFFVIGLVLSHILIVITYNANKGEMFVDFCVRPLIVQRSVHISHFDNKVKSQA